MLTCEKCGFNQVPEYVKSDPDAPVLCVGCRMSKFVKDKNDLIKTTMRSINAKQHEWQLIEF
ncbi:MAG: hypothetical protein KGI27_15840, partial [Thaumarchaeota archaeon]|nr:hypothetical protein [Nitrososphaerota archaeon]